jgi:hypothetical protein
MPILALATDVTGIIPLMSCDEPPLSFFERMTGTWVPHALSEPGLLDIMFLLSCRHLAISSPQERQQEYYTQLGFKYKLKCLQSLRRAISIETPAFSDSTVAQAIMLAFDEVRISFPIQISGLGADNC